MKCQVPSCASVCVHKYAKRQNKQQCLGSGFCLCDTVAVFAGEGFDTMLDRSLFGCVSNTVLYV